MIGKDENRDKEVRRPRASSAGSYPKPNRPKPRKSPRPEPRKTNWRYDNAVYRGRRKPDLYVSQERPAQDAANIRAALPDMDEDMAALARQTADKLDTMHDADFEAQQFHFTDE